MSLTFKLHCQSFLLLMTEASNTNYINYLIISLFSTIIALCVLNRSGIKIHCTKQGRSLSISDGMG